MGEKAPFEGVLVPFPNYSEFEEFYAEAQVRRDARTAYPVCTEEANINPKSAIGFAIGLVFGIVVTNQIIKANH